MAKPTVAVVGASPDRAKFGNKSVRAHVKAGYSVFPVHPTATEIEGLPAYPRVADVPVVALDRVSVYLPPSRTLAFLNELTPDRTREIWLNPGSYDSGVLDRARELGLPVICECSIVNLGLNPHDM